MHLVNVYYDVTCLLTLVVFVRLTFSSFVGIRPFSADTLCRARDCLWQMLFAHQVQTGIRMGLSDSPQGTQPADGATADSCRATLRHVAGTSSPRVFIVISLMASFSTYSSPGRHQQPLLPHSTATPQRPPRDCSLSPNTPFPRLGPMAAR